MLGDALLETNSTKTMSLTLDFGKIGFGSLP
jgi:hypothetical protein